MIRHRCCRFFLKQQRQAEGGKSWESNWSWVLHTQHLSWTCKHTKRCGLYLTGTGIVIQRHEVRLHRENETRSLLKWSPFQGNILVIQTISHYDVLHKHILHFNYHSHLTSRYFLCAPSFLTSFLLQVELVPPLMLFLPQSRPLSSASTGWNTWRLSSWLWLTSLNMVNCTIPSIFLHMMWFSFLFVVE